MIFELSVSSVGSLPKMSEKSLLFQNTGPLLESGKRCEILTLEVRSREVRGLGYLLLPRAEGCPQERAILVSSSLLYRDLGKNGSEENLGTCNDKDLGASENRVVPGGPEPLPQVT